MADDQVVTLPSGAVQLQPVQPRTWAEKQPGRGGEPLRAKWLERDVSSAVAWHRARPTFQAVRTASYPVPHSTWTPIPLDTEMIDSARGHNDTAAASKWVSPFTATPGGVDWWLVTAYLPFVATSQAKAHVIGVRVNGGGVFEGMKIPGGPGHATGLMFIDMLAIPNNDSGSFELMAWQNTGAAVNTEDVTKSPSLTVRWMAGNGTPMPQPNPATWQDGQVLSADASGLIGGRQAVPLNREIRDVIQFLHYPPVARLTAIGSTQTIPPNVWTSIQLPNAALGAENYGGWNSGNNTVYTCQRAGLYFVAGLGAVGEQASGNSGMRSCRLLVNGSVAYGGASSVPATDTNVGTALYATALLRLNVGDTVAVQMYHNQAGVNLPVKNGNGDCARLIVAWQSF